MDYLVSIIALFTYFPILGLFVILMMPAGLLSVVVNTARSFNAVYKKNNLLALLTAIPLIGFVINSMIFSSLVASLIYLAVVGTITIVGGLSNKKFRSGFIYGLKNGMNTEFEYDSYDFTQRRNRLSEQIQPDQFLHTEPIARLRVKQKH